MKHKLIIQVLAGLYSFSLLNSFIQLFIDFTFNPAVFYLFLFALLIIFFILYFGLKPIIKVFEAKRRRKHLHKKRLLLGINIFLVFRHFDITRK